MSLARKEMSTKATASLDVFHKLSKTKRARQPFQYEVTRNTALLTRSCALTSINVEQNDG